MRGLCVQQADVIQREVGLLPADGSRLKGWGLDFHKRFRLLSIDVATIIASTDKIASRCRRIEELDLVDAPAKMVMTNGDTTLSLADAS